jgi:hypothetical protein
MKKRKTDKPSSNGAPAPLPLAAGSVAPKKWTLTIIDTKKQTVRTSTHGFLSAVVYQITNQPQPFEFDQMLISRTALEPPNTPVRQPGQEL